MKQSIINIYEKDIPWSEKKKWYARELEVAVKKYRKLKSHGKEKRDAGRALKYYARGFQIARAKVALEKIKEGKL